MKTIRKTSLEVSKLIFNHIKYIDLTKMKILEPSAGDGDLLDNIINLYNNDNPIKDLSKSRIDCLETNDERRNNLHSNGYNIIGKDFLTHIFEYHYDLILACPPFKNGIDTIHIQKMYEVLKKGGKLVTLTHPRWLTENNSSEAILFRKFLDRKKYNLKILPDNSFMEKSKSIPTCILIIDK